MKLSAPKKITWWIAVIVGVIGTIGLFVICQLSVQMQIPGVFGFVLLALATY